MNSEIFLLFVFFVLQKNHTARRTLPAQACISSITKNGRVSAAGGASRLACVRSPAVIARR
jgi:hypothetical protein